MTTGWSLSAGLSLCWPAAFPQLAAGAAPHHSRTPAPAAAQRQLAPGPVRPAVEGPRPLSACRPELRVAAGEQRTSGMPPSFRARVAREMATRGSTQTSANNSARGRPRPQCTVPTGRWVTVGLAALVLVLALALVYMPRKQVDRVAVWQLAVRPQLPDDRWAGLVVRAAASVRPASKPSLPCKCCHHTAQEAEANSQAQSQKDAAAPVRPEVSVCGRYVAEVILVAPCYASRGAWSVRAAQG